MLKVGGPGCPVDAFLECNHVSRVSARCPVLEIPCLSIIAKPVDLFLRCVFCTQMEIETSPALLCCGRAVAMRREALDSAEQSIIADYARGRGSIDAPADTIQGLACADKLPSDGRRFRHSISNRPRADTTLDRP